MHLPLLLKNLVAWTLWLGVGTVAAFLGFALWRLSWGTGPARLAGCSAVAASIAGLAVLSLACVVRGKPLLAVTCSLGMAVLAGLLYGLVEKYKIGY